MPAHGVDPEPTGTGIRSRDSVTTFALIHGGLHGGWCWELLVPELEAQGHEAVAPDLPIDDDAAGARAWAEAVADALGPAEDVVAVGHSMGGLALPVLAAIRPVRRMVFLSALVPIPGARYSDYLAAHPETILVDYTAGADQTANIPPYEVIRDHLYQDCEDEVVRRAYERFRPQSLTVFTETCPVDRWPEAPSSSIVMTADRCVGPEWSRRMARERLQTVAVELPGGHSPFYADPGGLATVLSTF